MTSVSRRFGTSQQRFERPSQEPNRALLAPVVLMVSGGADSSALLLLAATSSLDIDDGRGLVPIARERLHVLHVNHGLRGLDAQEDEEFVVDMARRWGIPCTVRHIDVPLLVSQNPGSCFEGVARDVRYQAANELANQLSAIAQTPRSAARIVTAHTANDRLETFFMNAIRGTGAQGLTSIPRRRNRIARPLLDRTHDELCDLLRMQGLIWREDATNQDTRYLRNFVRHKIVPLAQEINPRVAESVASTCEILSDEDAFMTALAMRAYREVLKVGREGLRVIDAARLAAMEVALARRVVRTALLEVAPDTRLEARHVASVLKLVAEGSGSFTAPLGVDVSVQYGLLRIRARSASRFVPSWLPVPGSLELGDGRVLTASLREVGAADGGVALAKALGAEHGGTRVLLDATAAGIAPEGGRVWVAPPEDGEVLCPLGMHGQSKRLSQLLADAHVPARERDAVPVVRTGPGGQVIWVANVRPDERVRVTPNSKTLVLLSIHGT